MDSQSILQAASTTATCVATITALYVGVLRPKRLMPKLVFLQIDGDPVAVTETSVEDDNSTWLRVRVYNQSKTVSASSVTCTITSATDPVNMTSRPLLVGRTLKWSNFEENETRIPPRMTRYLDVARLKKTGVDEVAQIIPIYPRPVASSRHIIATTSLSLEVALSAENATTSYWRISLRYADAWVDDMSLRLLLDQDIQRLR